MSAEETARRLAAHARCPWLPGMWVWYADGEGAGRYGMRLDGNKDLDKESWILIHEPQNYDDGDGASDIRHDLEDMATAGVLLGLLCNQRLPCETGAERDDAGWQVRCWDDGCLERFDAPTLGEAAALALLESWDAP